jgi:hypothetical protein
MAGSSNDGFELVIETNEQNSLRRLRAILGDALGAKIRDMSREIDSLRYARAIDRERLRQLRSQRTRKAARQ